MAKIVDRVLRSGPVLWQDLARPRLATEIASRSLLTTLASSGRAPLSPRGRGVRA
jgi:hypothetical protein